MTGAALNRGDGTALWKQIAEQLEEAIVKGTYQPGGKLPTEHALADAYGVNRHTVRRALGVLSEKGIARVEQGRGSFVQESVIDYRLKKRTRFSENIASQNGIAGGSLLRSEEVPALGAVARELGLRKGSPVIVLEILRNANDRPIDVATHYFAKARFPGMDAAYRSTGSISLALAECGLSDYTRKLTRVTARIARSEDARLLQQAPNRPILMTESVNVDGDGRPVEYCVARFASDRVQLLVEPGA
jgi:GntR family phosphonate transport system transcriptional regulator